MASELVEKTAFTTHSDLYEFVVMLFDLCHTSLTSQQLMKNILTGLARDICIQCIEMIY